MTNKERIEELQAQRKALNAQIRALKNEGELTVGLARIARKQTYAFENSDQWQLQIEVTLQTHYGNQKATQYRTLFTGSRQECIEAIPQVIHELTMLYQAAKGVD